MTLVKLAGAVLCAGVLCSQSSPPVSIGPLPDGSVLLPTGWRIQPVGQQVALDSLPLSSILSHDGKFVLVLNGGQKPPSIQVFAMDGMRETSRVPLADGWLGLTWSPDGRRVYVGGGSRGRVYEFTFSTAGELQPSREFAIVEGEPSAADFVGDVKISPDGQNAYAALLYRDAIAVISLQSGKEIARHKTGRRPHRIVFHADGRSYFVSAWADASVFEHQTSSGSEITRIRLGPHPADMLLADRLQDDNPDVGYRLYVAAANTNSVFVVNVTKSKDMRSREVLNVAMAPRQPLGMTPSGLALSRDQKTLFVACSDANVVAVADLSEEHSRLTGFIPAGWYPTAVRALPDGRVLVLNGRSDNLSVIPALTEESLDDYTRAAQKLSPYRDALLDVQSFPDESVIYSKPGRPSPIQHVVYIVTGNQAKLDQSSAPNHHKLAREFVRFDNFFASSSGTAADGLNWSIAAIAPDYTARLAPSHFANPSRKKNYDFEGGEPANTPPAGYLWNNVLAAGLSMRNYGWFVDNRNLSDVKEDGMQVDSVRDPALRAVTSPRYRGVDPSYADSDRARAFFAELQEFERSGSMPRLMLLRLGNDHDQALGLIVEAISNSRFWPRTAIFVAAANAPNGRDHRSVLLALSPYTRRGAVDSSMYSTPSVLRTIGLILGLKPMTHFDAAARSLAAAFTATPNPAPYVAEKPRAAVAAPIP